MQNAGASASYFLQPVTVRWQLFFRGGAGATGFGPLKKTVFHAICYTVKIFRFDAGNEGIMTVNDDV